MVTTAVATPAAPDRNASVALDAIWDLLRAIPDPEIPAISIVDLGIVRGLRWDGEALLVTVTPTYSGCPATEVIHADIKRALLSAGIDRHRIEIQLSPAWTTEWIDADARERLRAYGIAPPGALLPSEPRTIDLSGLARRRPAPQVGCPRCGSVDTELLSRFGSTPCKAQYRCRACAEPFDHFKPH